MKVAVYRQDVLPYSETFIRNQVESFRQHQVHLLGLLPVAGGLAVDAPSTVVFHGDLMGTVSSSLFKATRWHPRVAAALTKIDADVVLAHFAQDGFRLLPTATRAQLPVIVYVHGSDVLQMSGGRAISAMNSRWSEFVEGVTHFVAASEYLAKRLVARGVPAAKVSINYVGVPVRPLGTRPVGSQRSVLFVGRLISNKGLDHLIRAMARQPDDVHLHVIGDGPERGALERFADSVSPRSTTFHGRLDSAMVRNAMEESSVVCVPSVEVASGASEGFGQVAIEAQERARPVVAYSTGGLPETIAHGESGFVVPAGDVDGLASALSEVLSDPSLAQRMGNAGRSRVETLFNIDTATSKLERRISELKEMW